MAKISEITSSKPFLLYDADFQQPPYVANCWWNKFIKILHHIIGRFIFWYTPCFNMVYTSFLPSTAHSSRPPARNLGCARPPSWMAHSTWSTRLGRHGQVMKATRAKFHQFAPWKIDKNLPMLEEDLFLSFSCWESSGNDSGTYVVQFFGEGWFR